MHFIAFSKKVVLDIFDDIADEKGQYLALDEINMF